MVDVVYVSSTSSASSIRHDHAKNKVVVLGDAGVGKTTLVAALVESQRAADDDEFARAVLGERRTSTLGVDFCSLELGGGVEAQLWDTAGQERFAPLSRTYVHRAAAIVLVYDAAAPRIDRLHARWYAPVVEYERTVACALNRREPRLLVVAARDDLVSASTRDDADARAFAATIGAEHVRVSARSLDSFRRGLVPALRRALDARDEVERASPPTRRCACR